VPAARNPRIRMHARSDSARKVARWTFARVERWATTLIIGVGITLLGLPEDLFNTDGWVAPVLFGLTTAGLFEFCRRFQLLPMASLLLLFAGAFALGTGDASLNGVTQFGVYASAGSVAQALFNLCLFLLILAVGGAAFDRLFARVVPRFRRVVVSDPVRDVVTTGLLLLVGVSFIFAVVAGTWTFYGAQGASPAMSGKFRWDFVCEPAALSAIALVVDNMLKEAERNGSRRKLTFLLIVATLLTVILFMRQLRRVMLMALITSLLQIAWHPVASVKWFGSLRKVLTIAIVFGVFALSLHYGSVAWRKSSQRFITSDLSKRMEDTVSRIGDIDDDEVLRNTRTRLNYLWLEAASVEYQPLLGRSLSLPEMFVRTVYFYLPGSLAPVKYRYEFHSCETAFADMRLDADLACTPSSEGFIAGGTLGIIVVALAWTPIIGLGCILMRRRTALGIVVAMHMFDPMSIIETSAFPVVGAVRVAIIGMGLLTVSCVLGVVFFGWSVLGPKRRAGAARA
jgi:hypothetical protein